MTKIHRGIVYGFTGMLCAASAAGALFMLYFFLKLIVEIETNGLKSIIDQIWRGTGNG